MSGIEGKRHWDKCASPCVWDVSPTNDYLQNTVKATRPLTVLTRYTFDINITGR